MEQLKQLLTAAGIAYKENEPLAAHCTFKIGGPARLFVQPADRAQLCRAVALCKAQGVRYYLLGNGSNILFADEGYNGVVLDMGSIALEKGVEYQLYFAAANNFYPPSVDSSWVAANDCIDIAHGSAYYGDNTTLIFSGTVVLQET